MSVDTKEIIAAIHEITSRTRSGINLERVSKSQQKRERTAIYQLFALLELPHPIDTQCDSCYPW